MDANLKDILIKYKEYTMQIIKVVEEDNLDLLEELIQSRQMLVDKALNSIVEKEEGKKMYKELELDEVQEKLNTLMSVKLEAVRAEMEKVAKSKRANNSYNKRYTSATIFSKKI
ncbi:hypothetical protein [Clostridium thailandense]|uniref:Flagellar protein FliT n=1 Tax=Clostridium thailandense TaxID=2794346 RepID=A0A949X1K4_9CLOT|nr:hypothetical protein [Clostridium thailandense]MBV7272254.1 hypothetical protein [Clostridium thailandense]MCH5137800.1 hypothetical protein [Clostridiaceae bacterium UIB06]